MTILQFPTDFELRCHKLTVHCGLHRYPRYSIFRTLAWIMAVGAILAGDIAWGDDVKKPADPISAAVIRFQDRTEGAKATGTGADRTDRVSDKVTDLLSAELTAAPELMLVERDELDRILKEHELNLTGLIKAEDAIKAGQLTGAKLLITGSVIDTGNDRYLVAKIISTETSRVLGATSKGKTSDSVGDLVTKLAEHVGAAVRDRGTSILPAVESNDDRIAKVKGLIDGKPLPAVIIRIKEHHVGGASADPAAETEFTRWSQDLGLKTIDSERGDKADADIVITGEGISELSARRGGLVSVRARVEIRAVDRRTGVVLASDRQTERATDATELIAAKDALERAAAVIAERMLPKLVNRDGTKKAARAAQD